ncbi:MAG: hypothetical protein AAGK74_00230 [Chloroflexota bacterium]
MIFQHTYEKVLSGEKTQTRRLIKPNDITSGVYDRNGYRLIRSGGPVRDGIPYKVFHSDAPFTVRRKWIPGHTYKVQAARTEKGIGCIQVTGVRKEDVRNICWQDARAEGFYSQLGFWLTWCKIHDKSVLPLLENAPNVPYAQSILLNSSHDCYQAWVIEFELVKLL